MKDWTRDSRILVLLALVLVATACGSRRSHEDIVAGAAGQPVSDRETAMLEDEGFAAQESTRESSADEETPSDASEAGIGAPRSEQSTEEEEEAREDQMNPDRPSANTGQGSPVKVGSVGSISGVAGVVLAPVVQGLQVWANYVNDKGGVNGHPVELVVVDDGGDPARHRAAVQRLVEEGVVAFVGNAESITGAPSVEYITQKRVPVVGSDTGSPWFYDTSPMYFPQASSSLLPYVVATHAAADVAIPEGKRKWGIVACTEAQVCEDAYNDGPAVARKAGLEPVYRARASLAQPDFTAECLAARNSGVQILNIALDQNSVDRMADACSRVNFRPIFSLIGTSTLPRHAVNPNLDGTISGTVVFPWFQDNTESTKEFQAAMARYLPKADVANGHAVGWTAGKLFERATVDLPEPPTREAVLRGLWSIRDDTLGGLTLPLSFTENQPSRPVPCGFTAMIKDQKWSSPNNFEIRCF